MPQLADIKEYEAISVWNVTRGSRLETYAIEGSNPGEICANGAAAHLIKPGDLVIIASFWELAEEEIVNYRPRLVFVDAQNSIIPSRSEIPGPQVVNL